MTEDQFSKLPMQYTLGLSMDNGALRQYRNIEHRIVKEVYTPRNRYTYKWGRPRVIYYVEGGEHEYKTSSELYRAIYAKGAQQAAAAQ